MTELPLGDVASVIIAIERAALDRSDKGDPEGFLEISDADVVYFDPFLDAPLLGIDALRDYYHRIFDNEQRAGEMVNPRVQVVAGVAVLTFNYASRLERSGRITRWNSTEVYRKTGDGWRIIHTHWSFLHPEVAAA
jgi:ketosteroid isomerase-like protein